MKKFLNRRTATLLGAAAVAGPACCRCHPPWPRPGLRASP
jgi:hypothetical protein